MFVRNEFNGIFIGTPTNLQTRKILRDAGFVHVTGLATYNHSTDDFYIIGEKLTEEELGRCDSNNGLTVLVTEGGEVWLKAGPPASWDSQVIVELAPNGRGAFVPLSNGEQVSPYDLLHRINDPSYNIFVPASSSDRD